MQVIYFILLTILLVNALYLFIFSVAGECIKVNDTTTVKTSGNLRFLILLPGYKEDAVIMKSVESVLAQHYDSAGFQCVVIADSFQINTIEALRKGGAEVFVLPQNEKRNKANAIQLYLETCTKSYDVCIVLDADNCVEPDLLSKSLLYLAAGFQIVQAQRIAKNEHNSLSRLDSLSEIINNHIFRKGQRSLGFSSSLIGSGMIIEMQLFRKLMQNMQVFSGFDKELELRILKNKLSIAYAEDIIVYDEKVSEQHVFVNQRRRWTYAQFHFLKKNMRNAISELIFRGNTDYFNKVFQFALLPRIVCIGFSAFMILLSFFAGNIYLIISLLAAIMIFTALFIPVKDQLQWKELWRLCSQLPITFYNMMKAMVTSKQASKKFIHTPHQHT